MLRYISRTLLFVVSVSLAFRSSVLTRPGSSCRRGEPCLSLRSHSSHENEIRFQQVLFIETGFGCDQHGQNPTKAAVRAARNAIEFNSIPCVNAVVPGGYANMLLRVQVAAPDHGRIDASEVAKVFPYGKVVVELQEGGMRASSGVEIEALGDRGDDMLIAVCVVTVGY